MPPPSSRPSPTATPAARARRGALLIGAVLVGAASCDGCSRCAPDPPQVASPPPTVAAPRARDATVPPLPAAGDDAWMNSRIQRILQRQRTELDTAPRQTRRWTAVVTDDRATVDAARPGQAEPHPDAAVSPPPMAPTPAARSPRHDPDLEHRLRRELDETLAEIARVEALSRSVQARVQTADNRAELQAELQRIEGELHDLRALHRGLRDELTAIQGR